MKKRMVTLLMKLLKADNDDENCSGQMIVSTTIEQDDENENVDR